MHMVSNALALVTCIPRADSTTINIVLFMYANEVGARRGLLYRSFMPVNTP